jgi:CBS domain-containing protein
MEIGLLAKRAFCVQADVRLCDALATMWANGFSQLPIVDGEGKQVGSIREDGLVREYMAVCSAGIDPDRALVGKWTDDPFDEVSPETDVCSVLPMLQCAPAVVIPNDKGQVERIFTRADVVNMVLHNVPGVPGRPATWTYEWVTEICSDQRPESAELEFKEAMPKRKSKIDETVAAMANTSGGVIIIGVKAAGGRAAEVSPIPLGGEPDVGIRQSIASRVDAPSPLQFAVHVLPTPGSDFSEGVLVIEVARSGLLNAVDGVFRRRDGASNRAMTATEVGEAYGRCLVPGNSTVP